MVRLDFSQNYVQLKIITKVNGGLQPVPLVFIYLYFTVFLYEQIFNYLWFRIVLKNISTSQKVISSKLRNYV